MAETELTRQVGARMRAAAESKGYKQSEVAEMMDRSQGTVSRWWAGLQTPDLEDMARYAEVIGVSEGWLWTGREDLSPARLAETMAECLARIRRGESPSAVFDNMMHAPWHLTPDRRRVVDAAADDIRQYISANVPEWESLSEFEQNQAVLRLLAPRL